MIQSNEVNPNEQWIPLTSLEDMQNKEYDILIVGTGAGGGAALWRIMQQLEDSGKKIGIIEKGNLLIPTHVNNIATTFNRENILYYQNIPQAIICLLKYMH